MYQPHRVFVNGSHIQGKLVQCLPLTRHGVFYMPDGADVSKLEYIRQAIGSRLSILSPEEDVAKLREAGFSNVSLFYAGFSFKG